MKIFALLGATALAIVPMASSAGGLAPAVEEAPMVIMDTPAPTSTLAPYIVPVLFIALVAAAAAVDDTDEEAE